jgi:hypothetical protein
MLDLVFSLANVALVGPVRLLLQLICGFVFRAQSDLLEAHFGQSLSLWAV